MNILMMIFAFLVMLKLIKEMLFVVVMELNSYFFRRRCNKFLEHAKEGMCYRDELSTWFEVEQKAYKKRQDKIDDLYNLISLVKEC